MPASPPRLSRRTVAPRAATSPPVHRWLVAALVVLATTVLPVRTAWSAPAVRLEAVPVTPGEAVLLPHPSSHLGVRWNGDHEDVVELRWRSGDGPWRGWEAVEVSHDLGDESRDLVMSGLSVVSDATEAEVRVASGAPASLEVVAIDTRHGPRRLDVARARPASALDAGGRVPQPNVIPRWQWGADESIRDPQRSFAPLTRMAVHHTVTTNADPDPAATVRAIYSYHVEYNGWNDIGYNFLVDAQGRIYEGRHARSYAPGEVPTGEDTAGRGVTGAHVADNNTGTVGVALLGDFTAVGPSQPALDSLRRLLAWKADRHHIDPTGTTTWSTGRRPTIIGHRDASATACPGDLLYPLLPDIRRAVAASIPPRSPVNVVTGYWVLGRDGTVHRFGEAAALPVTGAPLAPPAVSVATTPGGGGLWVLSAGGRITTYGDAGFFGSTEGMALNRPAVRLEPTPTGRGYWVLGGDGGIFSFGDAAFHGSTGDMRLNAPVINMATTPSGGGYWLLGADGGVFTFGDAAFHGSTGAMRLNAPVVSMAPHPSGRGYWLQASDGGIFSFGAVAFHGSVPALRLAGVAPSMQIRVTPSGAGYYVLGSDGGIFTFGDGRFHGAEPGLSGGASAVDQALRLGPG